MPSPPPALSFTARTGQDSSLITPMSLTSPASINTAVAAKKRRKSYIWGEKNVYIFYWCRQGIEFNFSAEGPPLKCWFSIKNKHQGQLHVFYRERTQPRPPAQSAQKYFYTPSVACAARCYLLRTELSATTPRSTHVKTHMENLSFLNKWWIYQTQLGF